MQSNSKVSFERKSARLVLLRQHPILGLEVMSGVGDELRVAWMIDGFDSDDNPHQPRIVLADVLDQLGLGIGWPRNENRASVCDRLSEGARQSWRDQPVQVRPR